MTVAAASLKLYYSGGATNSDPALSLGGAKSSVALSATALNNLFDDVTGDEATAGNVEYRCLYFQNIDSDATGLIDPVAWISAQPNVSEVATGETVDFGLEAVQAAITSSSVANPSVITTDAAHGLEDGQTVVIAGHSGSTPDINGSRVITVIDSTSFSIPVNVTTGGTGGTVTGTGLKNTVAQTVVDTDTAPDYVVFDGPGSKAAGTALPGAPYSEDDFVAIWFRRTTPSSQAISVGTTFTFDIEGES